MLKPTTFFFFFNSQYFGVHVCPTLIIFCQVHWNKPKNSINQFATLLYSAFAEVKLLFPLFLTSQWLHCRTALTTALTGDNMLISYLNFARAPSALYLSYEAETLYSKTTKRSFGEKDVNRDRGWSEKNMDYISFAWKILLHSEKTTQTPK